HGLLAALDGANCIVWNLAFQPRTLQLRAYLLAPRHSSSGFIAVGLDGTIYLLDENGESQVWAQSYQGRVLGLVESFGGEIVTLGADGTLWYWHERKPKCVIAMLSDETLFSLRPNDAWPISITRLRG